MCARVALPLFLLSALLCGCGALAPDVTSAGLSPAMGARAPDVTGFSTAIIYPAVMQPNGTAVAGWLGQVTHGEPPETVVVNPVHSAYRLDSGDKLRIFVYAQPSLSRIYTIDTEGLISVPLIGTVRARGLTTPALERVIADRLATQFVRDPNVTVDIQQYRPFFILGEVKTAGQFPFVSGLTVDAAVAIAGGYSERADERKVQITRRIADGVEKLVVPGDAEVRPGDTIYVRERWF